MRLKIPYLVKFHMTALQSVWMEPFTPGEYLALYVQTQLLAATDPLTPLPLPSYPLISFLGALFPPIAKLAESASVPGHSL